MLTCNSATPSASVCRQRRNQIFSVLSNLDQFLRTLSSTQRLVLSTMTTQLLLRTHVVPTPSNTLRMLRSLACQPTTPATSFFLLAMLVVSYHQSQSSTPPKLCSISSPVTRQRWLVPKTVSPSHKLPSPLASLNLSWLCILCDTLRCWLTRLSTTRLMLGC